ncbi:uncharacterized protein LODBEIA_P39970 [Lodderomyces beijingensis]|uniref:Secreted protein n=1 Tax=Lodderomyces beijingensis TaxID=1775926 RepID=A0ABP0ZNQ3_9ASCO
MFKLQYILLLVILAFTNASGQPDVNSGAIKKYFDSLSASASMAPKPTKRQGSCASQRSCAPRLTYSASEPFSLAAFDPSYDADNVEDNLMSSPLQKLNHDLSRVFINHTQTKCKDTQSPDPASFISGRVLANGSLKVDNLCHENLHFLRVDSMTHRLKLCPSGDASSDFKIVENLLYYKNWATWSLCQHQADGVSYIYHGGIMDNLRFCCPWDEEIEVRCLGKMRIGCCDEGDVKDYVPVKKDDCSRGVEKGCSYDKKKGEGGAYEGGGSTCGDGSGGGGGDDDDDDDDEDGNVDKFSNDWD